MEANAARRLGPGLGLGPGPGGGGVGVGGHSISGSCAAFILQTFRDKNSLPWRDWQRIEKQHRNRDMVEGIFRNNHGPLL